MKITVTESDPWKRTLEVEVPGPDVESRFAAAYKSYGKNLKIPGFRKGKVPAGMVKKRFGKAIQGEVLQTVMEECYLEASRSEGIRPVSEATIEDVDYEEGQPLRFKASVDIKPEIDVSGYRGLKAARHVFRVEESMVEDHLRLLQNQNATEQVVDRNLELGDVLVADIQEVDEAGVPIVGRRQEGQTFLIGTDDGANHDLNNQLVGIFVEEERTVTLHRAEDPEHPGDEDSTVRFRVLAKEVRARELPELDDEFAKDLGEFDTLEALKGKILEDFQSRANRAGRSRLEESIVEGLVRENPFDLPESMIENYLNSMVERYKEQHKGHDHPIDEEAFRKESRGGAVRGLKRFLLLESVASKESISVEPADIDAHLEGMSKQHQVEPERLREVLGRTGQMDRIQSDLLEDKTLDFLVDQADIEDVEEPSAAELT